MLYRILFVALFASALWGLSPEPARAGCGEGYLERYDRRGEAFCLSVATERKRVLALKQAMRTKNHESRTRLNADRLRLAQRAATTRLR